MFTKKKCCERCGEPHSNICRSKKLDCPCHKSESIEWENELEENLNWLVTAQFMENPYKFEKESPFVKKKKEEIIASIENLLEQERNRMSEEIEKLKQYNSHIGIGGLHSADMQIVHNDAIDKALSIINK